MSSSLLKANEIEKMPTEEKTHFLNPNAVRINRSLGDATGLKNLGVHLIEIAPGRESTEYHSHGYEEECLYILKGSGLATINDEEHEIAAGDFLGFPCDGTAHGMINNGTKPLLCLVMGQRLAQDTADYPHQAKRLFRNSGVWELLDHSDIELV